MQIKLNSISFKFNRRTWYVHWIFLLIIVWMLVINLLSVTGFNELVWGVLLFIAFMLSIFVHEAAHILSAKAFELREGDLLLLPSGCVGGGIDSISNLRVKTIVLMGGPLTNLAIAFLLKFGIQPYSAYWNEPANIGVVDPGNFLFQLHLVNLSLGIINLIPVLPMDAGRILRGTLDMRIGAQRSKKIMSGFSKCVAIAVLIGGIYYLNLLVILFAIYVLFTRKTEDQLPLPNLQTRFPNAAGPLNFFFNRGHFS